MKPVFFTSPIRKTILSVLFLFLLHLSTLSLFSQTPGWLIDSASNLADGLSTKFKNVKPGDTVYLKAGVRDKLLIRNFTGLPDSPIVFMNKDSITTISTNSYYGLSIQNCRYIRLSGTGNQINQYGIQIEKVLGGAGIGVGGKTSDFEIDHISIQNCLTEGIMAKTDPDCSFTTTREYFTQFNTTIHDNYINQVGDEGLYIGSSYYSGIHLTCSGKDTVVFPSVLNTVKIYNNIISNTGWDGLQVSSAPLHCEIHHNTITNDSQKETKNQMSGILMGGGSKCNCYNNKISDGKGDGIEEHGLGGNKIYNNIIVNAGKNFLPNDPTQRKHGIFVSDNSVLPDSSFSILFNDIVNPKSDGIRFQSVKSKNSLIASNLIINPGAYDVYENDNTSFSGKDAYVMIPYSGSSLQLKNNFFTRSISEASVSVSDYSILNGSPLINTGYQQDNSITTDFMNGERPVDGYFDIGAIEYVPLPTSMALRKTLNPTVTVFPNPVHSKLILRFKSNSSQDHFFYIYTLSGQLVFSQRIKVSSPGMQQLEINTGTLMNGTYIFCLKQEKEKNFGRFIKE